jgi:23S rRNA U2552 (ribose-2'-O)-methylase RlmE/FtsJ
MFASAEIKSMMTKLPGMKTKSQGLRSRSQRKCGKIDKKFLNENVQKNLLEGS